MKPLSRFGPCGRTVAFALAAFAVALVGCGDDAVPSVDGGEDGGTEGGLSFCSTDDDCNDGIACTTEFCNDLGVCQFRPDHSQCSDDVFCNGEEVCSLTEGCIPAYRTACNDNDVCTIDECDEEAAQCTHAPRDIDGDGDPDSHCANGGDCDDRDPRRASTFSEVCTDLVDNDCDGLVDEPECGAPPGDTCDTAIDVSGGGLFELYLDGAARDYSASCVPAGGRDLAFSFTLTEPMDVDIAASGIGTSSVALFAECGDLETEFECDRAVRAEVRARALPAGTYGGVVFSSATGLSSDEPTVVTVDLAPATDPPANEACGGAEEILSSGVVHGSLVDVSSDLSTACFAGNTPDLVYFITTDAPHDIQLTATSSDGSPLAIETRTTCDDVDSSLRCVRGIPADTRLYSVPAGTYYFIVESAAGAEPDFDLKVEVLEPTMPPAGDVCDTAIAIPVGMTVTGTLAGAQDDHTVSCGLPYRDVVYTFELDAPKDVFVQVDSGNTFAYAAVSNDCGNIAAERLCIAGASPGLRMWNVPAGTYYLLVESFASPSLAINVAATGPTPTTPVTGNTSCNSAYAIPATGGVFTGSTVAGGVMLDTIQCLDASGPEAVFMIELDTPRTLTASTEGSAFDTVLSLRQAGCTDASEVACNDSAGAGDTGVLAKALTAGTYYLVVDGFSGAAGDYVLAVSLAP